MGKDPRDGLTLRPGYELAREIERSVVVAPGVSNAAIRAVNSVLFQRLQEQTLDNDPTARINMERIHEINVTNIASENGINRSDLQALLESGAFKGPQGEKGEQGDKGVKGEQGGPGPPPPRSGRSGGPATASSSSGYPPFYYGGHERPPQDPPAPKMRAVPSENTQAERQDLELQAGVQEVVEEMRRQSKHHAVANDLLNRLLVANQNPKTEIIRELQTVVQPTMPVPQAPSQHAELMGVFTQAMASQNHDLGKQLERMGMSMAEFIAYMKEKDVKPVEDPVMAGPGPPPPPGAGGAAEFQIGTPRGRSRTRSVVPYEPPPPSRQPTPAPRDPSIASTIRYPSEAPVPRGRDEQRSRSRGGAGPEVILPIDEGPRGRSLTRKPEGPLADKAKALLKKQEQGVNMGESRIILGKFAKSIQQVRQKAKNAEKAASVPPPKPRSYDDIEKEVDQAVADVSDTRLRKKPQFPEGAFLKRNRMNSAGERQFRYQGAAIRV